MAIELVAPGASEFATEQAAKQAYFLSMVTCVATRRAVVNAELPDADAAK